MVTHGAGHATDLMARVLLRPGDVPPSRSPATPRWSLLRSLGIQVVGVPVDEHGLVVDAMPPRRVWST